MAVCLMNDDLCDEIILGDGLIAIERKDYYDFTSHVFNGGIYYHDKKNGEILILPGYDRVKVPEDIICISSNTDELLYMTENDIWAIYKNHKSKKIPNSFGRFVKGNSTLFYENIDMFAVGGDCVRSNSCYQMFDKLFHQISPKNNLLKYFKTYEPEDYNYCHIIVDEKIFEIVWGNITRDRIYITQLINSSEIGETFIINVSCEYNDIIVSGDRENIYILNNKILYIVRDGVELIDTIELEHKYIKFVRLCEKRVDYPHQDEIWMSKFGSMMSGIIGYFL